MEIALKITKTVDIDFLFNVSITKGHENAGIYCGDLEKTRLAGYEEVAKWMTVNIGKAYDLVTTNGGE